MPSKPPVKIGSYTRCSLRARSLACLLATGCDDWFVSNSANLGATMDLKLLSWFVQEGGAYADHL
mgnify:CR=1 FL=1